MTELGALFGRIEANLRRDAKVDENLCGECESLPESELAAFQSILAFLGCKVSSAIAVSQPVPKDLRLQATKLLLLRLKAQTDDPAWSSSMLEQLLNAVTVVPGGEVGDVILALHDVLGEHHEGVSPPTGHLILQVVVGAFSRHRASYEASDLSRLTTDLRNPGAPITPAQAYLMLHALPEAVTKEGRDRLLSLLSGTPYADEAREMLEPGEE